jgi:hypothetical protein
LIWTFLQPLFLWGTLAALVPLILHLMQRRQAVTVQFSTVRFLKLAQKKSSSRIRMENLLLWLLRTLLLLLAALAFAGPVLRSSGWGKWLGRSQRDVAIVVDASYSMGYDQGGRSVWAQSLETAANLVEGLEEGDRVCLFVAHEDVSPVLEQPTADRELARSLVAKLELSRSPSRLRPAIAAAAAALKNSPGERELYVFTDGQALPWADLREQALQFPEERFAAFLMLAGVPSPLNATTTDVAVEPDLLVSGAPLTVRATFSGTGSSGPSAATLKVDGQAVDRRAVSGPSADFSVAGLAVGRHEGEIEIPEDSLAADNRFHFVLNVREEMSVLCVGASEELFFLDRALRPSDAFSFFKLTKVDAGGLEGVDLAPFACVFLVGSGKQPGGAILKLEQYVRDGGVVAVFPGDRETPQDYAAWSLLAAKPREVAALPAGESRFTLRLLKADDPIFASLRLPPGTVPSLVARRALLWGEMEKEGEALVTAGEDLQFMLGRRVGRGRVLQFAVPADRRWSNFPITSIFVPLLHQVVRSAGEQGRGEMQQTVRPRIVIASAPWAEGETASLVDPDGKERTVQLREEEGRRAWILEGDLGPGIYRLASDKKPVLALNLDRRESDLGAIDARALEALPVKPSFRVARSPAAFFELVEEHRIGRPMAESLLWAVMFLSVIEVALANWLSRPARTLSQALAVDDSGRVRGLATE